jgi:hypothetical protein
MAPPLRSCWAAVATGLLASAAASAQAAELSAAGPAECADAEELEFRVERSIGMPLRDADSLSFDVLMEQVGSGHRARIDVRKKGSDAVTMQRVLLASDCDKLASAISVAVALALGASQASVPGAESLEPAGSDIEAASGAPAAASASSEVVLPESAQSSLPETAAPDPALVPAISLWMLGDVGSLPSPAFGVALGVQTGWRRFELRALGTLLFEQEAEVESPIEPGQGARLELMTAALSGCAAPFGALRAAFAPVVCLGMELGRLAGVGTGVDFPRRGSALWVAPLAQVAMVWSIPQTSLRLSSALLGAAPLNRDEFALGGIGSVHQPPPLIGRWALGVGMQFD